MKIVLWAFHEAGYRALRQLAAAGHQLLVVAEHGAPYVPSVPELATALDIPLLEAPAPEQMRREIEKFGPDLGLSMYYPRILPEQVIAIPRLGSFNFHPSLLPRHKGCFSAPWAILEGDTETGVTCHKMLAAVDNGDILCQSRVSITSDDTGFSLYYKLADSAVDLLKKALRQFHGPPPVLTAQKTAGGCFHKRGVPYDGVINPCWDEHQIDRFIRAMHFPPFEPAVTIVNSKRIPVTNLAEYQRLLA